MDIAGTLKDNIKVFLPVVGLLIVIVAFYLVDLDYGSFTSVTPAMRDNGVAEERNITYQADVYTSYGTFRIDLYENLAPKNVENFITLANEGFYNNLKFHRVIENFVIQTGDPLGDGTGNAGYYINDEITSELSFAEYTVGMANEGRPNTNSSQFFVTLKNGNFSHLDDDYTIIGKVIDGFRVVDRIGSVEVDSEYFPKVDVFVERIEIIEDTK